MLLLYSLVILKCFLFLLQDLLKKLPEDFLERARYLFTVLLDFCVNMICEIDEEELLADLHTR